MRWREGLRELRGRLIATPDFREVVQKLPIIHRFANSRAERLFGICAGFVFSQVLLACVRAGIFEALEKAPMKLSALATRTGLPEHRLHALLRAATALELLHDYSDGRYGLGELGAALCHNDGLLAMIAHHDALYADLAEPLACVSDPVYEGRLANFWAYAGKSPTAQLNTDSVDAYSRLMSRSQTAVASQVLDSGEFAGVKRLLDVGGGDGSFAIAAAERCPALEATVVDLPAVVSLARSRIEEAGLSHRIETRGLDFRRDPLPKGHDAVSLVRIVHDHDDGPANRLLAAAGAALAPGGRIYIAEPLVDDSDAGRLIEAYFSTYLLAMGQGRPRRYEEIESMLGRAGFNRTRRLGTRMPLITSLVRARKAKQA
jgi:demethylspheroidene O-methyltransferase